MDGSAATITCLLSIILCKVLHELLKGHDIRATWHGVVLHIHRLKRNLTLPVVPPSTDSEVD
jgi:hypothetical protein